MTIQRALVTSGLTLLWHVAAQDNPTRALYQITSGKYTEVGGIMGELTSPLPNPEQAFVALVTDPQAKTAELSFLGEDLRTVFRTLTNGVVQGQSIRFHYQTWRADFPNPEFQTEVDYAVTRDAGGLRIDGTMNTRPPPCCDFPYFFEHTKVLAVPLPNVSIRTSEVELCWNSESNRTYQVQYRSELTTDSWTNLGAPIPGTGSKVCCVDKVPAGEPKRFYRALQLTSGATAGRE